jgi:hypothetical protein
MGKNGEVISRREAIGIRMINDALAGIAPVSGSRLCKTGILLAFASDYPKLRSEIA